MIDPRAVTFVDAFALASSSSSATSWPSGAAHWSWSAHPLVSPERLPSQSWTPCSHICAAERVSHSVHDRPTTFSGDPRSAHPSRAGRGSPPLRPPNRLCAAALTGSFGVARSVLPSPRNGNLIGFYDKQTVSRKMAHSSRPVCRSRRSRNPETALAPGPSPSAAHIRRALARRAASRHRSATDERSQGAPPRTGPTPPRPAQDAGHAGLGQDLGCSSHRYYRPSGPEWPDTTQPSPYSALPQATSSYRNANTKSARIWLRSMPAQLAGWKLLAAASSHVLRAAPTFVPKRPRPDLRQRAGALSAIPALLNPAAMDYPTGSGSLFRRPWVVGSVKASQQHD